MAGPNGQENRRKIGTSIESAGRRILAVRGTLLNEIRILEEVPFVELAGPTIESRRACSGSRAGALYSVIANGLVSESTS